MKPQPEVLYITYDGLTDQLGQSQILPYLQGLSTKGYRISIVSCEKQLAYQRNAGVVQQLLRETHINWHFIYYSNKLPVVSALWNTLRLQRLCQKVCNTQPIKIAHCRSYLAGLIGLSLKKQYGIRFLFDMRGFWPDERVDGGLWNLKNPIYKRIYNYFKKKEKLLLQQADHIITLTQKAKEIIITWNVLPNKSNNITTIPCCSDEMLFNYADYNNAQKESTRRQLGITNTDYVITYVGSIGTWYMLSEMLDFYAVLLTKHAHSRFLFITNEKEASIKVLAKIKNIDATKINIVSATRNEVPLLLSISDLSLFFIRASFSKQASSPTKLAELMCMGIPVITNTGVGDVDSIINESKSGILINEFTEKAYQEAIEQIPNLLDTDKIGIRSYAIHHFSLQQGVSAYNNIYDTLLAGIITSS